MRLVLGAGSNCIAMMRVDRSELDALMTFLSEHPAESERNTTGALLSVAAYLENNKDDGSNNSNSNSDRFSIHEYYPFD